MMSNIIIAVILAYLLGSIPTSFIFGKLKGIDIRKVGSGNVGATNALRILGTKIGIITLLIDILKGFAAISLGKYFLKNPSQIVLIILGISAILGHIFTVFLNFKGGKGVATSTGVFLALLPVPLLIALAVFVVTVFFSKYVSLGSILASITLLITELIINIRNSFADLSLLIFVFFVSLFIVIRHKANIKRIIAGNENKISFRK